MNYSRHRAVAVGIDRLRAVWPTLPSTVATVDEFSRALDGFEVDTIEHGFSRVIASHGEPSPPKPKHVRDACAEVVRARLASRQPQRTDDSGDQVSPDVAAFCWTMVRLCYAGYFAPRGPSKFAESDRRGYEQLWARFQHGTELTPTSAVELLKQWGADPALFETMLARGAMRPPAAPRVGYPYNTEGAA